MSESINGGLAFAATLDIDDFDVSAEAMERRIRNVSNTTVLESTKMDQSIQSFASNGAKYIIGTLVGGGMMSLVNSIVQTRGQFQQLDIAFETMLGSAAKGKMLMDQVTATAAKTPFDLMGVAGGAKQLLAYGTSADKVNDTLVRLGNIASGLSIPLGDMVYLYGTTQTQGRLFTQDVRQFMGRGIPLVKEMAAMLGKTEEEINDMVTAGKIGFPEVEKVINKMTDSGGQFFNLMEKQSASLTGMISNLGDAWDTALNKLGADNQEILSSGISGAAYMVEHLDDILQIVKAITIAYGSYKAAIVLNTLATKGYTGVALLDNIARQAKIALMKVDEAITGKTAAVTARMTAAQEAQTLSLQKQLTVEERTNIVKQLRIATIQQLLTAQQQEYISNLGLTASSQNYQAVAMGVMSVDQRQALAKTDLSAKSAIYQAALAREVLAKNQNQAATLASMRTDVKAAASRVESAKVSAVMAMQATEAARYEVYWAKQSGDTARLATAEKKLEGAVENQAISRKAALSAQTDFHTKKKLLETTATRQSTTASVADSAAKVTQGATTTMLTAITTKCTLALKAMWASMMSNPIGWILGLVGALVSVFTIFSNSEDEATDAMGDFQDSTKKETDSLNTLMAVLKNTEAGTKSHKQALEKINEVCKEYNIELLKENSSLTEQTDKYDELTKAIEANSAAKIKAKYTEQILQGKSENQSEAKDDLKDSGSSLKESHYYSGGMAGGGYYTTAVKSIQNMNEAIYDQIEVMATESAEKLKGLTGDSYTKAYGASLQRITKAVQAASGASDSDMSVFQSHISKYLTNIVKAEQDADKQIKDLTQDMDAFAKAGGETPAVVASIDYAKMSFSELDKKAKDSQDEIDKINAKTVKVETDNTRITELLGIINQVNTAITGKTANLNTESGINDRIKQLQDERSTVEINSEKYKELSKTIQGLQKKLPKTVSTDDSAKKAEQLVEKQKQADLRAEQSRIDVMEDGYAKRKAILDLQHRQALAAIDKEERELEKARKEAGKGGLSSKEKQGFSDRRDNE
ncbi:MAG: tape measure protein, partial [Rikenellaceae bacterium]